MPGLADDDYSRLLMFRTQLRTFDRWSREQAAAVGLTQPQHQLLLAVRGHDDHRGPTIGDIAGYLLVRHHSAVELVDRVAALSLVARQPDVTDHRLVRVALTAQGRARVDALAAIHLDELRRLAPSLGALIAGLPGADDVHSHAEGAGD